MARTRSGGGSKPCRSSDGPAGGRLEVRLKSSDGSTRSVQVVQAMEPIISASVESDTTPLSTSSDSRATALSASTKDYSPTACGDGGGGLRRGGGAPLQELLLPQPATTVQCPPHREKRNGDPMSGRELENPRKRARSTSPLRHAPPRHMSSAILSTPPTAGDSWYHHTTTSDGGHGAQWRSKRAFASAGGGQQELRDGSGSAGTPQRLPRDSPLRRSGGDHHNRRDWKTRTAGVVTSSTTATITDDDHSTSPQEWRRRRKSGNGVGDNNEVVTAEMAVDDAVVGREWRGDTSEDSEEEEEDEEEEEELPPGDRVAYIHVGEGGEADLEAQLKGEENLDIQILEEEDLPDIDETDMIHGLDHTGTARDYVDERHRCTIHCPVGCQGHLRPNEIVIYESFKFEGRLRGRKRYKGRIIYNIRYRDARDRTNTESRSSNSRSSKGRIERRPRQRDSPYADGLERRGASATASQPSLVDLHHQHHHLQPHRSNSGRHNHHSSHHNQRRGGEHQRAPRRSVVTASNSVMAPPSSTATTHNSGSSHGGHHNTTSTATSSNGGGRGAVTHNNSNKVEDRRGSHINNSGRNNAVRCTKTSHGRGFPIAAIAMSTRLQLALDLPPPARPVMEANSWNPDDRSLNIYVKEDDLLTLHRHPVAQSTDCIRSKVGYESGLHVFELTWPVAQRGTHAVVGLATGSAPLHSVGYQSLIGNNAETWGWDLGRNKAYHDSARAGRPGVTYPACLAADETFQVPDKFIMVLDMDAGTMAFIVEGNYLGVAHTGLKGRKLHIIVSAVWGHCEITMRYLAGLEPGPLSLLSMARLRIRQALVAAASPSRVLSEADEADVNNSRSQQRRVNNSSNTGVMAAADPTRIDRLVLPRSMKFYLKHQDSFTSSSVDTNAVSDASSKCCA